MNKFICAVTLPMALSHTLCLRHESFPNCMIAGEDRRPLFVHTIVQPQFKSLQDVWQYISARKEVLNQLAAQDVRNIDVWVSLDNTSIEQLGSIGVEYGIRITAVQDFAVDTQDNYLYTFGRDLSSEDKEVDIKEFVSWTKAHRLTSSYKAAQFQINFIRGKLSTNKALLLQNDPRVALVDPTSDLIRIFAGQALHILVESMPQPVVYIRLFGAEHR